MSFIANSRQWARHIKRDALTLWFARNHPDTPWHAKALAVVVLAYALSPIDLIPDFIPVLGYLDDVLLLPALIWLAVRLLPPHVLAQARERAQDWMDRQGARPRSRVGAVLIVVLWVGLGAALLAWGLRRWG